MITRQEASKYFYEVVMPAIAELIEEYKKAGLEVSEHQDPPRFRKKPAILENKGIWVTHANGVQKRIFVSWPERTNKILIGNLSTGDTKLLIFDQADKEFLKERIRELINV